jgi:3-phenylpropionate/trans-cinnamate dioxygenase ferredoxin subunit
MAEWVKVAQVGELAPGQKKPIDLDGIAVLLFNVGGQYYAIEDVCTHDGAPLAVAGLTEPILPAHVTARGLMCARARL